jgi:hypothetical protein
MGSGHSRRESAGPVVFRTVLFGAHWSKLGFKSSLPPSSLQSRRRYALKIHCPGDGQEQSRRFVCVMSATPLDAEPPRGMLGRFRQNRPRAGKQRGRPRCAGFAYLLNERSHFAAPLNGRAEVSSRMSALRRQSGPSRRALNGRCCHVPALLHAQEVKAML